MLCYHSSKQTQDKLRKLDVNVLKWLNKSCAINWIESMIDDKLKTRVITSTTELIDHYVSKVSIEFEFFLEGFACMFVLFLF